MVEPIKFPIISDANTREIKVGKWVAKHIYYNYPMRENDFSLKNDILSCNGIEKVEVTCSFENGYLDTYKRITPFLGGRFYAQLRAVSRKVWITPIENVLNKYCLNWKWRTRPFFDEGQVRRAWKTLSLIEQLENDGMQNVIPIAIYFMETPQGLRRDLGKSIWKKIANNSLSFNLCLVRHLTELEGISSSRRVLRLMWSKFEQLKSDLAFLLSLKKTLARRFINDLHILPEEDCENLHRGPGTWVIRYESVREKLLWINKHGKVSRPDDIGRLSVLFRDTKAMASEQGIHFTPTSPKKMYAMHDKLARASREKRRQEMLNYRDVINARMKWLRPYSEAINLAFGNANSVRVEVIAEYGRLLNESDTMCHCVADYEYYISRQLYIVISLESDLQRSTLGLYLADGCFVIDQHYCFDNREVTCQQLISAAKKAKDVVNKTLSLVANKSGRTKTA